MMSLLKNRYIVDFFAAIMFFTRIPITWSNFSEEAPDLTRAAWSFPLVGFVIGLMSGVLGEICLALGLSNFLACSVAISLAVLLTGAFHEDGLADMADGFGAGGSPERVNEIMHDSRLGTYGVISLILGLMIRISVLATLVELGYSLAIMLSIGFATGKLSIILARNFIEPSNYAKQGSILGEVSPINLLSAVLIWFIPTIFIVPLIGIIMGMLLVFGLVFFLKIRTVHYLNGVTGDVLGATSFLSELLFLIGVVLVLSGVT